MSNSLRSSAEQQLSRNPRLLAVYSSEEILHELKVHQIELEMQNEALRQSQEALEISRDRYIDMYEFSPVGKVTISEDGLISEINLKASSLLGVDRANLVHKRFSHFVAKSDVDRWHRLFLSIKQDSTLKEQHFEMSLVRGDGSAIDTHLHCLYRQIENEAPLVRLTLVDISKFKKAETELRIAAIAFDSQEGMMITDANAAILRVNASFTKITGYTEEEVKGKSPSILRSGRQTNQFYEQMWRGIHQTGYWEGEIWNKRKNGEIYPEHLTISSVNCRKGNLTNYVATLTDITLSSAAAEEIKRLAFFDQLTGLANRQLLMDRLLQALASSGRSGKVGGLLFIDLDNFKTINDTLGHAIGDILLKKVADRLVAIVRQDDTVARLGGDEFVVMLENLSESPIEAATLTEAVTAKILDVLNKPYLLATGEYHSTPSIGVTMFNGKEQVMEELLKQADIAMYQAKKEGKNTVRFFDQLMQTSITDRAALNVDLRIALEKCQFKLYYQLQATHTGQPVGAEALIRWEHPVRGLVTPLDFIPYAEESSLILVIGQWVLETACNQLKIWEGDPLTCDLQLAVNVSSRQFRQRNFVEQVLAVLNATVIDPSKLKLELTESLVLENVDDTIIKMNALKEIGVRFSMDDFGTGFSSLAYLTQLPLSQIKIDQAFVRNIGVRKSDAVVIQTIIGMAKSLEIEVIAEGVETESQRAFLEQNDCPLCQGYLFSKPVAIEEFEALMMNDTDRKQR